MSTEQKEALIEQQVAQERAEVFDADATPLPEVQPQGPARHKEYTSKSPEELAKQQEIDSRSVYVRNLEFHATPDEIEQLFNDVGVVNRVTILLDKFTGRPRGYAYVEFEAKESVAGAIAKHDETQFKGRVIGVVEKRTNLPGLRKPRGRGGFRGRGHGRGRGRAPGTTDGNEGPGPVPSASGTE